MRTYKYIHFIIVIIVMQLEMVSCKAQYKSPDMSSDIFSRQKIEFPQDQNLNALKLYRDQSDCFRKINFTLAKDTIFLLERNGVQGDYFMTLWNRIDTVSYSNITGEFIKSEKSLFIKNMMQLVSEWDIQKLEEEAKSSSNLISSEFIYTTRIILKGRQRIIDCIRFDEFFSSN